MPDLPTFFSEAWVEGAAPGIAAAQLQRIDDQVEALSAQFGSFVALPNVRGSTTPGSVAYATRNIEHAVSGHVFRGHANIVMSTISMVGVGNIEISLPIDPATAITSFAVGRSQQVGHGSYFDNAGGLHRLFILELSATGPSWARLLEVRNTPLAMTWATFPVAIQDEFAISFDYVVD